MTIKGESNPIPLEELLLFYESGFKLVPLAENGKTPNVNGLLTAEQRQRSIEESCDGKEHTVNYIYNHPEFWNKDRISRDAWRFHNVATTYGKTHIKDEESNNLYLNEADIDSKEVLDRLAIIRVKDKDYFFIDEMRKITFVVKTKKKYGYRIYWLSHKQYPPIGSRNCKLDYEFEIKTDNTLGHGTLPPSRHRDDSNFRYQSIGQNVIAIRDELYDGILKILADCLRTKEELQHMEKKKNNTPTRLCNNNNKIILTDSDIEEITFQLKNYYKEYSRHNITYGLSAYLYKENVSLESAEKIILKICQITNDKEQNNRFTVLHNTYIKGQNGQEIVGYFHLLDTLTRTTDQKSAAEILGNISQVWKKYNSNPILEQIDHDIIQQLSRHTFEIIRYSPIAFIIAHSDKKQILHGKISEVKRDNDNTAYYNQDTIQSIATMT